MQRLPAPTQRRMLRVFATAAALPLALGLASCGSDTADPVDPDSGTAAEDITSADGDPGGPGDPGEGRGGPGRTPGISGMVAEVSSGTLQVQDPGSGQTTVTWSDATTITRQVEGSLDDVTVGACVMVRDADAGSEGSADDGAITAAQVTLTDAGEDGCTMPGGGTGGPGGRGGPGDGGGTPPEMPEDAPQGGPRGGFGGTFGTVTAVGDDGFTVETAAFGDQEAGSVDVTVDADTTYTTTAAGGADDLTAGVCVSATGEQDSTGALTATTLRVSDAVDGSCSGGFGGRGPGGTGQAPDRSGDA